MSLSFKVNSDPICPKAPVIKIRFIVVSPSSSLILKNSDLLYLNNPIHLECYLNYTHFLANFFINSNCLIKHLFSMSSSWHVTNTASPLGNGWEHNRLGINTFFIQAFTEMLSQCFVSDDTRSDGC